MEGLTCPKDQFTDLVLSWSLEDIFDDNLYKNQVEKIPESFQTVDQYLGSYVFPLLEETHTELATAMKTVYKAPFAEIISFRELKDKSLLYKVKVDYWRNILSDRSRDRYRTLPGDIVLLSDSKPEKFSDLQRVGWTYAFASVVDISDDENGENCFKLKSRNEIDFGDAVGMSLYVVYLSNVTTNKRIWNALHMRRNLNVIKKVLCENDLGDEDCEFCAPKRYIQPVEKFGRDLFSKLNESQNEAIKASLLKIECNHKSSVELIWGPPGTGKTATLSILLYTLSKMNVRTLVCAPTNVAITEVASRVLTLIRSSYRDESCCCPSFGEMLIFGNKDRLKLGQEVDEIYVDYRVERLIECLLPSTGWKYYVVSMIDFLEDCVSRYKIYVDNEMIKQSKENPEDEIIQQPEVIKSFLEYARDLFSHLAAPLKRSMLTLLTHLPKRLLLEQNYQSIMQLVSILDSFEGLLFKDCNMSSQELESIFQQKGIMGSESVLDKSSLPYLRSQCLSILKSLRFSIANLGLPPGTNTSSIIDFCFKKASLLFCTTSSAYKLHKKANMEPFNLLVIDEAAQVKECETAIALQIPGLRHAVLVGDECQLPAMVSSKVSQEAGFGRSLFERLSSLGHFKHLLNMQYRMHPSISRFPNSKFYLNQILDAPMVQSQSYKKRYLKGKMFGPYSFINIPGGKEESGDDDNGHSQRNMIEVAVIVKLVQKLFKAWSGSTEKLSIGLISPYAAQVMAIRDKLNKKYENIENFIVKVKSIDGFQGGEEDIIIISTVRSNRHGDIGFLSSAQRANVALTRARHCLWILGNERTLSKSDSLWEELVCDAKDRGCFFNADEDGEISKTIVNVKQELEQLDDLLNGDSILFKSARWKVSFSDNFRKSFENLNPSHVKKLAINLLLNLASGWRPKKINVDFTCEISSYIVKQFKVEGYYIVCSIDIRKDSIYEQVLKVWDILPLAEIPKLSKRLDNFYAMCTDDFINHCKEKCFEGHLEVPKTWSISKEIIRYKNLNNATSSGASSVENRSYVENSKVSESFMLLKFYSLTSGAVNHLLSDNEGREIDLPFEVTDEERKIILFPKSSFILGRSGTGKTTILTMKLYQKLQQYAIASQNSNLRQLFVTVSPKLCYAVKQHVSQLKSFASGNFTGENITEMDDIDEMAEFKDIPDTFIGIQPEKYPLIITFHKFLMMLDGTLGVSYFDRFHEVKDSSRYEGKRSVAVQAFIRKNEVTYDRFLTSYWPHFNEKLTKNLDPSRVFTEIMSHIKGSLPKCGTFETIRNREEYVSVSDSRASTIDAEKRNVIYDIFQDYEKMKLDRGEFDIADFVIDIHTRLENEGLLGDKMDFVYIDEVQDLNMRQISLFRYICKNVDEGFVFSGDTAQTIARGIDFRFEGIRSLFYNEFLMKSESCEFSGKKEKGIVSDTFNLSQNFRTHTGVLRLAQSVIDLLCHYFPHSVDVLAPETSLIYGENPVVLQAESDENLILSIFGSSQNCGRKWVGFGADQVILVRDVSTRNEVSDIIGHKALVLTIVECKGLEFQDVLLYNFFGSQHMSNQWRVVYEFLKEKDLLDANSPKSFPSFSHSRHNILCSELKQLYVAITRTRQRLWIWESNEEISKPMFEYWKRLCLVQFRKIDDSLADAMQRASNPEEWRAQGIKLFWEKNYEMASMCFEKAGEETWEKRAKASGLRASADNLRGSNSQEAHIMLREAAEIFDSIGRANTAAECFCDLGDYERAGKIYLDKCGMAELRKAGECFSLAGMYEIAAQTYAKGNFFKECLDECTKGKYFDMGLQYIEQWKQMDKITTKLNEIDKIGQEFLEKCALECYNTKNNASLMKFVRAFHTMESKRNFLKSLDCIDELLILEEESGNFVEAAEIAKTQGDILLEIDLLGKAEKFQDSSLLVISYVLSNSLWPLKSFPPKAELLSKAVSYASNVSTNFRSSICIEAKILLHEKWNLSELMKSYNDSKQYGTYMGEILSLRKLVDVHCMIDRAKYEWDLKLTDETISRNQVSVGTLVYVWNLLKAKNLDILGSLDSLERQEFIESEVTIGFCRKYFGVRLSHNLSSTYILMNPNAAWVRYVDKRFIVWKKKVATLEARHFASAARKYWRQELISIGLRVIEALRALYEYSLFKTSTKYGQSVILTWIFEISKFIIESKSLDDIKKGDFRRLNGFLELSSTRYFELVFPLDPRMSSSENIVSMRETEISNDILEKVISQIISNTRNELTYGQIGRVVMILLGFSKPKNQLIYEKIAERISGNSNWKPFIGMIMDSNKFCEALEETYNSNWRVKDYISPNCFLYLMERLLILVPNSRGFVFTTKSSFIEYLVSLPSDDNVRAHLVTTERSSQTSIVNSLMSMVLQFLNNSLDTTQWITNSNIDWNSYFPVMMLRLFMILCLLCLNSKVSFNIIFQQLCVPQIKCRLPREFCEAFGRKKNDNYSRVAEAFKVIGDPLVIVATNENKVKIVCPDAILLELRPLSSKNEIMNILFPRSSTVEENSSNQGEQFSVTMETDDSKTGSEDNGKGNLEIICSLNRDVFDILESIRNQNEGDFKSFLLTQKAKLEEHMNGLIAALSHPGEDNDALSEVSEMVEELKQLCSLFNTTSAFNEIEQVLTKLEAKKPQLDILLSRHIVQNEDTKEIQDSDESSKKDISIGVSDGACTESTSQVKGKNKKKNKKSKKGKGGRGK